MTADAARSDPDPGQIPNPTLAGSSYAAALVAQAADRPKGERSRAQLLRAVCELLEGQPPQDLTIAAICGRAGLSNGAFYVYFSDRGLLLDELLTGFVGFAQAAMRAASRVRPDDPVRAATRAYVALFRENRGLMRCLVHHLEGFPEARAAFHRFNRDWLEGVAAAVERDLARQGRAGAIARDELLRRAYALGGMVDQYLSSLLLSEDPALMAVSGDEAAVLDTLDLIWDRGMQP
ncbi:TetR/AcrR family transcriptional regulator [Antarcticimicrobium luteum]|uniref:TetR/AcrR family transcriptional regulator n=1 Tax=Antarcticimicrobium luteum TaxID=2547397 RepID=A0A4R5UX60_9RHOB|nr:TetR/AcrR family transcriptional regulator [Antarcticimicrobium luteum]TDK43910.1 TetR/AcrR family transcriptional regulator [Antarcticimicrobium luteum]